MTVDKPLDDKPVIAKTPPVKLPAAKAPGAKVAKAAAPAKPTAIPFRMETARLTLRCLGARDLPAHMALRADPQVRRFQSFPRRYGGLEALSVFNWMQTHDPAKGGWFNLCVAEKGDDRHAGDIAVNATGKTALIGVSLERRAQRQGYATEALEAFLPWLASRGIKTFKAEIDARNERSIALFTQRLGFTADDSVLDGAVTVNRYSRPAKG